MSEGFITGIDSDSHPEDVEFAVEQIQEEIDRIVNKYNHKGFWVARVKNFGWLNKEGEKHIENETDAKTLLSSIFPDTDLSFKCWKYSHNGLRFQVWHHDSPTGNEKYELLHRTQRELKEYGVI